MSQAKSSSAGQAGPHIMEKPMGEGAGSPLRKLVVVGVIFLILALAILGLVLMAANKTPPEATKRRDPALAVMAQMSDSDTVVLDAMVQGQSRPRTEVD